MKKTLRRVVALVVCLALMAVPMQFTPVSATTTTATQPKLAYVPLDDRPVVWDRVVYAAEAAGFDMETPEYDDIRTRLDNQGKNDNGTQHGDGASIMNWLEDMDDAGCDYFIIHLDMMFSGGLVGSRYPDSATITSTERDIFNRLMTLTNKADNHVYFIDIVMRLASTGGYMGYESAAYDAFRDYGMKERIVLDASNYGTTDYATSESYLTTIYNNYQKGVNGETLTFKSAITQTNVNLYHKHRLRKMQLMNMVIQNVPRGTVYMVGIDDASPGNNIQRNELNFLYARMTAMGLDYDVLYDTDSCALMMLARVVNDYYGVKPTVEVRYFGTQSEAVGDEYSDDTLRENVDKHIASMNAKSVTANGEIELLVLTKPTTNFTSTGVEDADYKQAIIDLVDAAEYNTANNIPTIIVDASAYYEKAWCWRFTNLQDEMVLNGNFDFGKILAYSNWNTIGNAIGIALGAGVSRYTYLKYEENIAAASHVAQAKSLTFMYVKDLVYNARHKINGQWNSRAHWMFLMCLTQDAKNGSSSITYKNRAGTNVTESGHWNTSNFYQDMIKVTKNTNGVDTYTGTPQSWTTGTGIAYTETTKGERWVNNFLAWYMTGIDLPSDNATYPTYNTTKQVLPKLIGSEIYTNLNRTVQTVELTNVAVCGWRFPWFRIFEITFDITPTLGSTKYHYYSDHDYRIYDIPLKQTGTTFINNLKRQHGITQVTAKNWSGTNVTSGYIGTDFDVTMTFGTQTIAYKTIVLGEVTGDGVMDSSDVRHVMSAVIDSTLLSEACQEAADFNFNGRIDSTDARQMLQVVTGL
ncbi:MAG: DUF4127 family protein [Clostridia bacterium]|nr:DUF4127 family protein [Clostridia bacterium]